MYIRVVNREYFIACRLRFQVCFRRPIYKIEEDRVIDWILCLGFLYIIKWRCKIWLKQSRELKRRRD